MKKRRTIAALIAVNLLLSGCSFLLPKKVEFFQDKVKAFPEAKAGERETQRRVAQRAEVKAKETLNAALATDADVTVVKPASETAVLTDAISTSLGPPSKPAPERQSSEDLANELRSSVAALNKRIDDFKKDNNENTGKKIEGTGIFQIGYFSMWAMILGVLALIVVAFKIWGMVNPVVGLGMNTAGRVSSTLLRRGLTELAEGGEWFKNKIDSHSEPALTKEEVKELFAQMQASAQSRDVQTLIKNLTAK